MIKRLLRDHLPLTAAVLSMLRDVVVSLLAADVKRVAGKRGSKTKRGKKGRRVVPARGRNPHHH